MRCLADRCSEISGGPRLNPAHVFLLNAQQLLQGMGGCCALRAVLETLGPGMGGNCVIVASDIKHKVTFRPIYIYPLDIVELSG